MISTYVVEDEERILEVTLVMLEGMGVNVLGSASTIAEAYDGIKATNPELVLLDVEVGNQTSFDLLNKFDSIDFKIVFVTAHQKYALDAFKFSAIDFILKPIGVSALRTALEKAAGTNEDQQAALTTLKENLKSAPYDQKLILKTQDKIHLLKLKEIIHCVSDLSYTTFHTEKETILVSKTLGYYDDLLAKYGFFRVHKSHLVNLAHVRQINKTDGAEAELSDGSRIPISQRKKDEFLVFIESQGLK